ncbi:hypothetical protein J2X34_003092 [Rhodococcus sp. BE178]
MTDDLERVEQRTGGVRRGVEHEVNSADAGRLPGDLP